MLLPLNTTRIVPTDGQFPSQAARWRENSHHYAPRLLHTAAATTVKHGKFCLSNAATFHISLLFYAFEVTPEHS